jgi:hypothetical protein
LTKGAAQQQKEMRRSVLVLTMEKYTHNTETGGKGEPRQNRDKNSQE